MAQSHTQSPRKTIGIIGSGIAGPVFALQILSHPTLSSRYRPIIFEQCKAPGAEQSDQSAGAAISLSPNGLFPLYELGLKEKIEKASYDMVGLSLWKVYHDSKGELCKEGVKEKKVEDVHACAHKMLSRTVNISWARDVQSNMRVMERAKLMDLLNERVMELGGEIRWGKKLRGLQESKEKKIRAEFGNGDAAELDMVVGADGAWSLVRRHILEKRHGVKEGRKRWIPEYQRGSNIYGISTLENCRLTHENIPEYALEDTHACWLDHGHLSTSVLPGGIIRWDLQLPQGKSPPDPYSVKQSITATPDVEDWRANILESVYPLNESVALLRAHADVYHPVTGTFGRLLAASRRIIHSPLRQQVWEENDIQYGNVVAIGDAARLLMPTSGQGTSFAVEDATVLADSLLQYGLAIAEEEQQPFKKYAKSRVGRGRQMATYAGYTCEAGLGRTWYWRLLRDMTSALTVLGDNKSRKHVSSWPFGERYSIGA